MLTLNFLKRLGSLKFAYYFYVKSTVARLNPNPKKPNPMSWNTFFGVASIVAFFFPVAIILIYRLYKHRSLTALMIYYLMTAAYSIMSEYHIPMSTDFRRAAGVLNNYLDVPLMLIALLFFCPNKQKQRKVHYLTAVFIGYEIVIATIYGLQKEAVVYVMGPGIFIVLAYTFFLFSRQIKFTVIHGKNAGRTLMLASILFAYTCYGLVYYFYYIQQTPYVADAFLLYFISSGFASTLMAVGLYLMRTRIKRLREAKVVRKELALFFNN